jgi:hypothetical protein
MSVVQEQTLQEHVLIPLSRKVATTIGARPNHCATNAWRALIECPDLFREGGHLVEGWFVIEEAAQVTLVEHVWCCLANGLIVDPSVLLLVEESTPVFYFPGVMRTSVETEALEGAFFPHVRFDGRHGDDGLGHPGYKAARAAARRKAYTRALARKPPKALQFLSARDGEAPRQLLGEEDALMPPTVEEACMDFHLSLTVCQSVQAEYGQCWSNARKALLEMPQTFFTATYVEGWCVGLWQEAIRVTEHGWIWSPRYGIVDPSMMLEPVPRRLRYVPAVQISWLELQQYATTRLPLARSLGWEQLSYQEACEQAMKRAEAFAWETGLPVFTEPGGTHMIRIHEGTLTITEMPWDFPLSSIPF